MSEVTFRATGAETAISLMKEAEDTDITAGELKEGYKSVAKQLADKFGFKKVAITLRESKFAFGNDWSAMIYDVKSGEYCFSKLYHLHIIDLIGGGDSSGRVQR